MMPWELQRCTDDPAGDIDFGLMPLCGDVRHDYPPGTALHDIKKFEVWDGARWVSNTEKPAYQISEYHVSEIGHWPDGGIPQCLLRDKDNTAPFMRINPAGSLPVTSQSTLPPWAAKS